MTRTDAELLAILRGDRLTADELRRYSAHAAALEECERWRRAHLRVSSLLLDTAWAAVAAEPQKVAA